MYVCILMLWQCDVLKRWDGIIAVVTEDDLKIPLLVWSTPVTK